MQLDAALNTKRHAYISSSQLTGENSTTNEVEWWLAASA